MKDQTSPEAPRATKIPKALSIHGDTRIDDYYWLNERENEAVIQYLKSENEYKEQMMAHLKPFQDKLYQEIVARLKPDEESAPYKDNGYFYLARYEKGKEHPIYSRKKETLEANEEVMLDENELAKPHNYYNIGGRAVSPDNRLLVFGEDTVSRRIYTLRFKSLETGEMLEDTIPGVSGTAAWANDNKTIFYAAKDPTTLRTHKIYRHVLGTPVEESGEVVVKRKRKGSRRRPEWEEYDIDDF